MGNPSGVAVQIDTTRLGNTISKGGDATILFDNTTDTVQWSGNPVQDGDTVYFTTSGSMPSGLTASLKYYVKNRNTNGFQVSSTETGEPIDFTTDGTDIMTAYYGGLVTQPATSTTSGVLTTATQEFAGVKTFNDGVKPSSSSSTINNFIAWTDVSYNSSHFTTDTGTWTVDSGDQLTYAYTIFGNVMTVYFTINFSSISSSPTMLKIAIPANKTAAAQVDNVVSIGNNLNKINAIGYAYVTAAGTTINLRLLDEAAFATSTDFTLIHGQISFKI